MAKRNGRRANRSQAYVSSGGHEYGRGNTAVDRVHQREPEAICAANYCLIKVEIRRKHRDRMRSKARIMKAVVISRYGEPEVLELREVPEPEAGPEDLLVTVKAAALNRADLLQRRGLYPPPDPQPEFDIPGLEFAGEVSAVGSRCSGFESGDRVMGLLPYGGCAEKVALNQRLVSHVPEGMPWIEAGAVPEAFITAHDALAQCGLLAGESLLVHAAGSGVGVAAIQIAKVMGASWIAGTAGSAAKLSAAAQLGLDLGINYREEDFAQRIAQESRNRATKGVDVVLDVIGAAYLESNLRVLAEKGRMIVVGVMGGISAELNLAVLLQKRLQIRGTLLRARALEAKAAAIRAFETSVLPHLASGRIRVVVDKTFPLDSIVEAHQYMESNANFGKIVLEL